MSAKAPRVRGWCPGALRPMQSGDGLIARLRITGGIVGISLARHIAAWSESWGNGQIDLSNRANLQLRGLSARDLPPLHAALAQHGLLDAAAAGEAVRNVVASPLAGLDPHAVLDIRPIVADLERYLTDTTALHALPGKFGFAVDDGGSLGLDGISADILFVARRTPDGPAFTAHLTGAPREALGPFPPGRLTAVAQDLALGFLGLRSGREASIRRMRNLVAADGVTAIGHAAGLGRAEVVDRPAPHDDVLGSHHLGAVAYVGVGLPFGRATSEDLLTLTAIAAANGTAELRLTPWRAILIPVPSLDAARAIVAGLDPRSFILNGNDARGRVAACPGAPSCVTATVNAREDATRLASVLPGAARAGITLHVSGCSKGCAHPARAPFTLVGRDGRYDFIRNGIASDAPSLRGLTLDQAASLLRRTRADPLPGDAA